MRLGIRSGLAPALAVLLAPVVVGPSPGDDICDVRGAPRIVAVGDVHGAYDNFVKVLRMMGLVDENLRWSGGETHLVQTGDVLDHGKDTRQVLDLLMRLEQEAEAAGGRVHALMGNHEVMNILEDARYVDPDEYEAFVTPESEKTRQKYIDKRVGQARLQAHIQGKRLREDVYRASVEEEIPLGLLERTAAFSPEGKYGKWIRARDVVARVNGIVFLHGGLTPEVAALGCPTINATVHHEINEEHEKTLKKPQDSLTAREKGPLWYRGLAREDETAFAASLEQVLRSLDVRAIVVAHTVTRTGRIQTRFGGRVVLIDAGMAAHYGGHLAALEIGPDGRMTAVYPDAREALERPVAADAAPAPDAAVQSRAAGRN